MPLLSEREDTSQCSRQVELFWSEFGKMDNFATQSSRFFSSFFFFFLNSSRPYNCHTLSLIHFESLRIEWLLDCKIIEQILLPKTRLI